jgi:hypothetical protein
MGPWVLVGQNIQHVAQRLESLCSLKLCEVAGDIEMEEPLMSSATETRATSHQHLPHPIILCWGCNPGECGGPDLESSVSIIVVGEQDK